MYNVKKTGAENMKNIKGYLLALNSENQLNRKCIGDSKEYNH